MFPYPWNSRGWMNNSSNGPDQMWNSMWNPSATAPHAPQGIPRQFCGGDPQLQQQAQSQAQTQAQIKALQQQNALLNQHLANQSFSHIQHLQQLIPQPSAPPQTPHPPVSVHQEPPSPKAQPTVPPPFDSEEMMKKMRLTLQADLDAAIQKSKESQPPLPSAPPASTPTPPLTQPSVTQPSQPSHPPDPFHQSR